MVTTTVRKGQEVLQVAFNVRMLSNVAKIQKVPFDNLFPYLSGQVTGSEGTELERNICVVFCAIEEGLRLQKKVCTYKMDDIWDWMMENTPEFNNAMNAIFDSLAAFNSQISEEAEVEDDKKK